MTRRPKVEIRYATQDLGSRYAVWCRGECPVATEIGRAGGPHTIGPAAHERDVGDPGVVELLRKRFGSGAEPVAHHDHGREGPVDADTTL